MQLSIRLKTIASFVEGYHSLADIACDHGYLGIYCAINFGLTEVLLTDINELPLKSAENNIRKYKVQNSVKTALGDGLNPLAKAYDVIVISGIGGRLMVDILAQNLLKVKMAKRLILSANNDLYTLRLFLARNGLKIMTEVMVEDYKYYEILVVEPTEELINYSEEELKYGPYLLKNKSKEFITYYHKLLNTLESQLVNVEHPDAKNNLFVRINEIKNILN